MTTFSQLLEQFDNAAKTTAAKGRRFERFCQAFLQVDPFWSAQFAEVWTWDDWPGRGGRVDTGVDLVARKAGSDDFVAIQCKFYSPSATLSWTNVSTFAGMLGSPEFSEGLLISTAGRVSDHVTNNLDSNEKTTRIWGVEDFEQSRVDWSQFSIQNPTSLVLALPKTLRPHQVSAIADVTEGFTEHDRGQLIMACGTGKTLTSLRLAEQRVGVGGTVLFLVPSINLLSQTVLAWANDAELPLATFAVCSDIQAGRRKSDEDMSANDLSFPATTDVQQLSAALEERATPDKMTVVFSTYQSIDVIIRAQSEGLGDFDLVICDEAHRTTGAFRAEDDQSVFTMVHDGDLLSAKKRLYMTATPRIYGDQTKRKAQDNDVILASMDDEDTFGPEFHHLSFGEAVGNKLLSDYKVIVLAVNEESLPATFQKHFTDSAGELALGDAARIVGCWHGLSKRGPQFKGDSIPMRRAVAFSSTIKQSKAFTQAFPALVNAALADRADANAVRVETDHVDGTTNVKVRSAAIRWLQDSPGQRTTRVLSNAKCLTEGVDVPALDAVLFLQPRKSIVDVVQAVGRVMRLSEGKDFGYVILPVGIPAGKAPEEALKDNDRYRVVWQVLQALRSHDERLAAEINKIDINGSSERITVIGIGMAGGDQTDDPGVTVSDNDAGATQIALQLPDLDEWRNALYARIVERVGDRQYLDSWASDIAQIAASQEARIRAKISGPQASRPSKEAFDRFVVALRAQINSGISDDDALGMLSQHVITKPVFDALFGESGFSEENPVSVALTKVLDEFDGEAVASETQVLTNFYDHVRNLVGGIDTSEGRQKIITELYEKFFRRALPKAADSLGIVYTPIPIVDFILQSVQDIMVRDFNRGFEDLDVNVLDPFTGTGTFIVRLIQSGLIPENVLARKLSSGLHANEIVLLAYYVAAMNIEQAGASAMRLLGASYQPFPGIVLADTFELGEEQTSFDGKAIFPINNARAEAQQEARIDVIVGNPPYSVGQRDASDNNQNRSYPRLDKRIAETYVAQSQSTTRTSAYDSYVRAIRWASDRIGERGIVSFVTNNSFIDGKSLDGLRKSLLSEFDSVFVINLRGNLRLTGREQVLEGGNVFGVRVGVAIWVASRGGAKSDASHPGLYYFEVPDSISGEEKLSLLSEAKSILELPLQKLEPNDRGDWINQRTDEYESFVELVAPKRDKARRDVVFLGYSSGLLSGRDAWCWNFSRSKLLENVNRLADEYNEVLEERLRQSDPEGHLALIERTGDKIPWSQNLIADLKRGRPAVVDTEAVQAAQFRPFSRRWAYTGKQLIWSAYSLRQIFPPGEQNIAIGVTTSAARFSAFAIDSLPGYDFLPRGIFLPRWQFRDGRAENLFGDRRSDALSAEVLERAAARYERPISADEMFAYVYGMLNWPEFVNRFHANLVKDLPRVPLVEPFDSVVEIGQALLDLHLNFETCESVPLRLSGGGVFVPADHPEVRSLDFVREGRKRDMSRLLLNGNVTIEGFPSNVHEYRIGARSPLEWLVAALSSRGEADLGLSQSANDWVQSAGNPAYWAELIGRLAFVSVRTQELTSGYPSFELKPR